MSAWENMERKERDREVERGEASSQVERFITANYKKELELNEVYKQKISK